MNKLKKNFLRGLIHLIMIYGL